MSIHSIMRFSISITRESLVEMPGGARILSLTYEEIPGPVITAPEECLRAFVWAVVNESSDLTDRRFECLRNDDEISHPHAPLVGNVELSTGTTWHVFDLGDDGR